MRRRRAACRRKHWQKGHSMTSSGPTAREPARPEAKPWTRPELRSFWKAEGSERSCIDLFAGCGGLALGLQASGWRGLFAIEKDPMAFDTFRHNFLRNESPFSGFADWP